MERRNFLKLGLMGTTALTTVGLTGSLVGCSDTGTSVSNGKTWKVLRAQDRTFFRSVAPVMLKGSLPDNKAAQTSAIESMIENIDLAIFNLGPHSKKQMIDLFMLLDMSVTRGLTTGVWSSWDKASADDIDQFLHRWRDSSIGLFRLAYNGLNKLMVATWYGQPASWQTVQYPGPPYADVLVTGSVQEK